MTNKKALFEETIAAQKVLSWFFSYPLDAIGLNDLASAASISKTTANKIVKRLEKDGFLKIEDLGKIWRITCNREHPWNLTVKVPLHTMAIYESGILSKIIEKLPGARAIMLFGSYRKGDDTDKSDLDIAVEIMGDKELEIIEFGLMSIGYRQKVPVKLHIFTRNKVDLNVFANIANGIVLYGFLEVRP